MYDRTCLLRSADCRITRPLVLGISRRLGQRGGSHVRFPSDENVTVHQGTFKMAWRLPLRRAKVPYLGISELRSIYATRLSVDSVADEWVTPPLRQADAEVFKSTRG
jgi:hypothetical protein